MMLNILAILALSACLGGLVASSVGMPRFSWWLIGIGCGFSLSIVIGWVTL